MNPDKLDKVKALVFSLRYTVAHLRNVLDRSGREPEPNMRRYFVLAAKLLDELEPMLPKDENDCVPSAPEQGR